MSKFSTPFLWMLSAVQRRLYSSLGRRPRDWIKTSDLRPCLTTPHKFVLGRVSKTWPVHRLSGRRRWNTGRISPADLGNKHIVGASTIVSDRLVRADVPRRSGADIRNICKRHKSGCSDNSKSFKKARRKHVGAMSSCRPLRSRTQALAARFRIISSGFSTT